ncbi:hypothetical protein BY996DRAFT_6557662 [Phakopsora pachyrhizi]|nr:hypothetical protein BY996DRAFT_6557662 [Phakopsora pachyrhizi]
MSIAINNSSEDINVINSVDCLPTPGFSNSIPPNPVIINEPLEETITKTKNIFSTSKPFSKGSKDV